MSTEKAQLNSTLALHFIEIKSNENHALHISYFHHIHWRKNVSTQAMLDVSQETQVPFIESRYVQINRHLFSFTFKPVGDRFQLVISPMGLIPYMKGDTLLQSNLLNTIIKKATSRLVTV